MFRISVLVLIATASIAAQDEPPREWIDPATNHRLIRLSDEPGSASLYFHQNAYTAAGDLMVFTTPRGLSVVDLKTRRIRPVTEGRVSHVVVGKHTRQVFYFRDDTVYATNLDTGQTRAIATRPHLRSGSGLTVNADETLLAGSFAEQQPEEPVNAAAPPVQSRADNYPGKGEMMERRLAARIPMALYTIDIKTGQIKTFNHSTDWLNHVQFSPTDPNLIMFCHEGPWHKVDRIS
jgi:oligogalacturonide lyase